MSARSAGGEPITCGCREHLEPAVSRAEARVFNAHLSRSLGSFSPRRKCRHFSHFDSAIAEAPAVTHEEATRKLCILVGECAAANFRGVRPQLSALLVVLASMARRDGYSLRVLADTALLTLSTK